MSNQESQATLAEARNREVRLWAMVLHLSVLAGFVVPLAGLIVPLVIWLLKKEDIPEIDAHGKIVVNWIISAIIYGAVSYVLTFLLIGFLLLIALAVLVVIFPIIGAIKAYNGEIWRYPLSIQSLK